MLARLLVLGGALLAACGRSPSPTPGDDDDMPGPDAPPPPACTTPAECEQNASDALDAAAGDPTALAAFAKAMPKGGDLHNHLSGAVYAESLLGWGKTDGACINSSSFSASLGGTCGGSTQPVPVSGAFFDQIVRAWSMEGFVPGAQSGHDHFFATFGKFGAISGTHRDDTIADIAARAADENQLYIETMFNLGKNIGTLSASLSSGTLTAAGLPALYDAILASPSFASQLASDVAVVADASTRYRTALGCDDLSPPAACDVDVRFVAQVSRTGANDQIFGQLVSAYEMAAKTERIVAANLSSPEDDSASIANYELHMAMLDFLHGKYTATGKSPLHVTLHAGELVPKFLPPGSTANTFHIRRAVEVGHAERIGHGIDIMSESDPAGLMAQMAAAHVLVEVCLSSNDQILEVRGAAHPLAAYLAAGVPVALATDDQGVSRSSLAGEIVRAVRDQHLDYRQLKLLARQSLEHAFLPGASLWTVVGTDTVADCRDLASAGCQAFVDTSERARMQVELERRFTTFEASVRP